MGHRLRYALVGVGLFLLFFAVIERVYAYPRLAKVPLDPYSMPAAKGTGTYFDVSKLQMKHDARLRNTRVVKGDPGAGSAKVAVWDQFFNTVDLDTGGVVSAVRERVVFDRVSGQPVHCCGESPRHDGLILNFPFDTKKTTYQFWDTAAGHSAPAVFTGVEEIDGLRTYRFEQQLRGARVRPVDLPGSFAGQPDVQSIDAFLVDDDDKTVWVEPVTGRIIKGQDHSRQTVQDASGAAFLTGFDATLTYTDETVAANVAAAKEDVAGLRLTGVLLPVGSALLGAVLLAAGLLLGPRRRALHVAGDRTPTPVGGGDGDGATERLRTRP
jgi:Porin PorA